MRMTSSLLTAFEFYRNCPESWKDKALDGLKTTLTGEFVSSPALERGNRFEGFVNALLYSKEPMDGLLKPCLDLRGLKRQVWLKPLNIRVDDMIFTFRGKMDYVGTLVDSPVNKELRDLAGKQIIVDLKTTGANSINEGRYSGSWQHIIYMLSEGVTDFAYFVYRFPDEDGLEPDEFKLVRVDLSGKGALQAKGVELKAVLHEFVAFLKDFNLWDDYFKIFNGGKA